MTTSTIENTLATDALEAYIADLESDGEHAETFRHEDGSVTVVSHDPWGWDMDSPRDFDGNVATLVMEHRDYLDLDDDHAGLSEARDRWRWTEWPSMVGGTRSDRAVKACGREKMMRRYLAMFRPDIVHYVDRWEVSGYSQSDWAYGWGYVTAEAMAATGLNDQAVPEAVRMFEQEVRVYEAHFRGDYYRVNRPYVGAPIVTYGEHGAYVTGYVIEDDEACGGYLVLDFNYRELAGMAGSPVVA